MDLEVHARVRPMGMSSFRTYSQYELPAILSLSVFRLFEQG
jgi:hypothetical protein